MPFKKTAEVAPGRVGSFHKLGSLEYTLRGVKATIVSYADQEGMESGNGDIVWGTHFSITGPEFLPFLSGAQGDMSAAAEDYAVSEVAVFKGALKVDASDRTADSVRSLRHGTLNTDYDRAVCNLAAYYPEAEQKSWFVQVDEARAWLADDSASTPWIDQALLGNGRQKAEFVDAIIQMNAAYRAEHGRLTGILQGVRSLLGTADTIEAVEAVTWDFARPVAQEDNTQGE